MDYQSIDLFNLDLLPPRCSIESQAFINDTVLQVRFRATKLKRFRREIHSEWSGWYTYDGEPIALHWETFWISSGQASAK